MGSMFESYADIDIVSVIINSIMVIIELAMFISLQIDKANRTIKGYYGYKGMLLFHAVYLTLEIIWSSLCLKDPQYSSWITNLIELGEITVTVGGAERVIEWLTQMIKERVSVNEKFIKALRIITICTFPMILILKFAAPKLMYMPYFLLYIIFIAMTFRYRNGLGLKDAILMISLFLSVIVFNSVSPFGIVLANISTVLAFFFLYLYSWQWRRDALAEERRKAEEDRANAEKMKFDISMSQVQPHFIYNTLSSIAALCDINPSVAQELTLNFASYLRENLNMSNMSNFTTFDKEFEHTQTYLKIEKVRFMNALNMEFDIKERDFFLPSLALQPIVENAVKHGIRKKKIGGTVKISTYKENEKYVVVVEDDGVGFDVDNFQFQEGHYGMKCTKDRIEKMPGGEFIMQSEIGVGTKIILKVQ